MGGGRWRILFAAKFPRKLPLPRGLPFPAFRIRMGLGVLGALWIPAFAGMTGWVARIPAFAGMARAQIERV